MYVRRYRGYLLICGWSPSRRTPMRINCRPSSVLFINAHRHCATFAGEVSSTGMNSAGVTVALATNCSRTPPVIWRLPLASSPAVRASTRAQRCQRSWQQRWRHGILVTTARHFDADRLHWRRTRRPARQPACRLPYVDGFSSRKASHGCGPLNHARPFRIRWRRPVNERRISSQRFAGGVAFHVASVCVACFVRQAENR